MKKQLIDECFKQLIPQMIYNETAEDFLFESLVYHDSSVMTELIDTYLRKHGEEGAIEAGDFIVDHTIDDEFAAIRVRLLNEKVSNIRKLYVVFCIREKKAVERNCYITEAITGEKLACGRVCQDGSYYQFEEEIIDDDDEANVIFNDFVWNK